MRSCILPVLAAVALTITVVPSAHASIGLVVGEPFGSFGTMLPAGHAAIYLDHLCAATPTHLRPCRPGEPGVVISRYHDLKSTKTDWLAFPATVFFYGVDDPTQAPTFITRNLKSELRESYRQTHLLAVAPSPKYGDWEEGIGATFDRRLLMYTIGTTPEQDAAILTLLNGDPNRRRYTLRRHDCADFAAVLLNTVAPHTFHRNELADFDIMSPKNLARQLDAYGHTHPDAHLQVYDIPQLPGTPRRSRPLRGAAETFLKTKRYLATLLLIQPEAVLADWIIYETKGKWSPGTDAQLLQPTAWPPVNDALPHFASETWPTEAPASATAATLITYSAIDRPSDLR